MLFEITFENGQLQMSFWPEFILIFVLPIFFISEFIVVKLGLKLAKAQVHKSFKWVILSVLIQIGMFTFVAMPFVLFAFMGDTIDFNALAPYLIMLVFFALFLDVCVINILHKIGFKRSIGVFILMIIPIFIIAGVVGSMVSAASMAYWEDQQGSFTSLVLYLFSYSYL